MVDFRSLSYFLVACEHENLGSGAREIGIAPSTLSASLKSLETALGVPLFRKHGAGLTPRRMAHWLYQAAVPLLLLEDFARRRVAATPGLPACRLRVDIRLRFTLGHFRAALAAAVAASVAEEPLLLVDPVWSLETGAAFGTMSLDSLGFDEDAAIVIETRAPAPAPEPAAMLLAEDRWVLVRGSGHADAATIRSLARQTLVEPAFPPALIEQVADWAQARRISLELVDSPPGDWPQLLDERPGSAILLPESAVGVRLGGVRSDVAPLDPPLSSLITAATDGSAVAGRFAARLKAALAARRTGPPFDPALTSRRIRYFNLAFDLGRVSAAARAASVAQPALSQQLHKLEDSVGKTLFDRRNFGLVRSPAAVHFAMATNLLERRLRELVLSGATASMVDGGRLSLGVLPSVSHHGHLVNRITDAVLALRERHPSMRVLVREAPNGTLQNLVLTGRVGLAIVETALSQMPRLALDATEELSVVADPRHALLPPGPVRLADLAALPLALPTGLFGLRQLLDAAARSAGVELRPRHEIDALSMLIALLSREAVATVLPASAVRPEILSRELAAHPIVEPTIHRRLFVIYSADRSLTPAERDLVTLLRAHLGNGSRARVGPMQLLA